MAESSFMSKNCASGLDGREFVSCGLMQDHVQVAAIKKKLLSKLHPEVERIFQRALPGIQKEEKPVWFSKMPLGHVVIGDMLPGFPRPHSYRNVIQTIV